ncbi:MAG: inosine-uridine nucleoside N-ribohydrolase [Granulosicoccus sp.]|jgi:inosine-uridine nucleoside N-ribohydrolase
MGIWVDTDFGFDDLWALLILRYLNIEVDGVSLVAGNVPLPQVIKNAGASSNTFNFDWPVYVGAEKPLLRAPETAERILGKLGMRSRGLQLPNYDHTHTLPDKQNAAVEAMAAWLSDSNQQHILAIGPLTNIALLLEHYPEAIRNIKKLIWMGGSGGRGNHSQYAEYNAIADPEALAAIAASDIPFRMIDLELCRQVTFTENQMPTMKGKNSALLADLLGGYLDIALHRDRLSMAIYDPLAALAVAESELFRFSPASVHVHTGVDSRYGQTIFSKKDSGNNSDPSSKFEYAIDIDIHSARKICFAALQYA